jgi:hypothetical protein
LHGELECFRECRQRLLSIVGPQEIRSPQQDIYALDDVVESSAQEYLLPGSVDGVVFGAER